VTEKQYELTRVQVRKGKLLRFDLAAEDPPIEGPIRVPFGAVPNPTGYRFVMRVLDGQVRELTATRVGDAGSGVEGAQILPPYRWTGTIPTREHGDVEVDVWQVTSDDDRARAMQIILRSHYLSVPTHGTIVGCRFTEPAKQELIRAGKRRSTPQDLWSEAWREEPGQMVGCAVLDTLWHSQPTGRKRIAEHVGRDDLLSEWETISPEGKKGLISRRRVLKELGIGYASRFAVDAPYRGLTLGSLLAGHLVKVGAHHRVPQSAFIEVITTLPTDEAMRLLRPESARSDFLQRAGYTQVKALLPSRRLLQPDPATGNKEVLRSAKKLYYYIETTTEEG
jgi:GNAT superfamily N-acetyltransferase